MDLFIIKIRIGSVQKKYRRARFGGCTLVEPPEIGEPTTRPKVVVDYIFFSKVVSGAHVSRFPKFGIKREL